MLQFGRIRPATCVALAAVGAVIALASARAERLGTPYRPAQTEVVWKGRDPADSAAAQRALLRSRLRAQPADFALASALARSEIEHARDTGDLRGLGRAEALLLPFAEPPRAELLVLRATIAQARHDFARALTDLDQALRLAPRDAQAHLTRASLLTVLGRYAEARASCARLTELGPDYAALLCSANLEGYGVDRPRALSVLEQGLGQLPSVGARAWAGSLACEHAFWGGEPARAARDCAETLALDPADRYTRALYADVLLEAGQAERALALAPAESEDDALLLRRALAALALGRAEAQALVARLTARFAASRARGDRVHQREEARLLLALGRDPKRALALARAGFAAQRELWDVRILLLAAEQAGEAGAAEPALSFVRSESLRSPLFDALVERLGGAS